MNPSKLALRLSWFAAVIIAILPFHAFLTTWAGSNFSHLDLWRIWKELLIVAMLPFVIWLVWQNSKLKKWVASYWLTRFIGIYLLLYGVMALWASIHHQATASAIIYGLIVNLRFLAFFFICLVLAAHNDWLKKVWAYLLLVPAGIVITFGLVQKLFLPYDWLRHFGYNPKTIPAYQTVDANLDYRRIQSTLRGANPLGTYLVGILTAITGILLKAKQKTWWLIFGVAGLVALYFTYSRSAWIGLAISVALLLWWNLGKKLPPGSLFITGGTIILVLAIGLAAVNNIPSLQDTFFHTSSQSNSQQSSNSERWDSLKNGGRDVFYQPLGREVGTAGPESFRNVGHQPRIAENYYLQIGQEVGVIGIVLFVAICTLTGVELWKQRSDTLAQILLASLIGISIINLLSHAWTDDTISLIWWGLAGVAIGSPLLKTKSKTSRL